MSDIIIGKHTLESLTTGMYSEYYPKVEDTTLKELFGL